MNTTHYLLRPRSGSWSHSPAGHSPNLRLLGFDMTVERRGKPLGGHNVQVVLGAPDQRRYRLDQEVALWLPSGWWVTFRNQFAQAPDVAENVVESAAEELSNVTAGATTARGADTDALTERLFSVTFEATGPDYWR